VPPVPRFTGLCYPPPPPPWLQHAAAAAAAAATRHPHHPQVVLEVLLSAAAAGRRFRVLVLDSRPELEGRQMLRRLLQVRVGVCVCVGGGLIGWHVWSRRTCGEGTCGHTPTHQSFLTPSLVITRHSSLTPHSITLQADISCGYVLLSGMSYIMREVTKV
jgi:hypothetical protein